MILLLLYHVNMLTTLIIILLKHLYKTFKILQLMYYFMLKVLFKTLISLPYPINICFFILHIFINK